MSKGISRGNVILPILVSVISMTSYGVDKDKDLCEKGLFVKVQNVLGVPTFTVSNDPAGGYSPFVRPCFETYVPEFKYFKQFAQSGTQLFSFNTNAAACDYSHSEPTWIDINTWDYSGFDARMKRVLDANPNAMVMPRINLGTPRWWLDANPNELEILDDGSMLYKQPNRNPTLPQDRPFPSIASIKWRQDIGNALVKFLNHIEEADYNDHIFGYFLAGLDTEEWYPWSSGSDQLLGYSPHMKRAFQIWLKKRYVDNATLQAAWNRPGITFEAVTVPSREERFDLGQGTLRDPAKKMNVIDFYLFYNEIIPETIDYFAATIKNVTRGSKVVGAFYGYMYEFRGDPEYGHNALEQYNKSKNIDFIFVTASYGNRQFATGGDYGRSPATSVKLHNKLWYHDNDVCSFLAPKVLYKSGMPEDDGGLNNIKNTLLVLGYTDTPQQTAWMYQRAMGFALCNGAYESFFDLHGGYYDDPYLMNEVKKLNRTADVAVRYDRSSNSEILIVSDEASCAYATFRSDLLEVSLYDVQHSLIKIGAPADHVLINDLELLDTDRYKLIIFLNNYNMTDTQRGLVDKKLKYGGKYLMWCYAPGYFNFNRTSENYMKSLTGFDIKADVDSDYVSPIIKLCHNNNAISKKLLATGMKQIGSSHKCGQLFYIDDEDKKTIVLGVSPEGKSVFTIKPMDGWTSIYSLTPALPPSIFRTLAAHAGVHIYNDRDDTFYANATYLCIHANGAGKRTIIFPWACDIIDAVSEKMLKPNSSELAYEFQNGETLLLRWKTRL